MKPKLRIFSNLARAGGTLVSRCLGSMDGVALLSEIHPYGVEAAKKFGPKVSSAINILNQAVNWYQLFKPEDFVGKSYDFTDITKMIANRLEKRDLQLIIRDWVHLDFMAIPFLDKPYYHSRLVEFLEQDFDIVQYHLVRHPAPQWMSTCRLVIMQGKLPLHQFLEGCYQYAKLCQENGFVRYEDFCESPEPSMKKICENLQIDYDAEFINKWSSYTKITGDVIPGEQRQVIKPAVLPEIEAEFHQRLHACEYYTKTLALLGYDDVVVKQA